MPQECVGGECLPLYEYVRQLEELDQMMSGGGQQAYSGGQAPPYGQQQGGYPPQQGGYPPQQGGFQPPPLQQQPHSHH